MENEWLDIDVETEKRIMAGEVSQLSIPESHLAEFKESGIIPGKDEIEAMGYQFPWGQLIETVTENIWHRVRKVTWDIRFDSLHAEYLAMGGNGNELADMSELAFERHGSSGMRIFHVYGGSLCSSSLTLLQVAPDREQLSREWICKKLLKGDHAIMRKIIADLEHINFRAFRKAACRRMQAQPQVAS